MKKHFENHLIIVTPQDRRLASGKINYRRFDSLTLREFILVTTMVTSPATTLSKNILRNISG